MIIVYWSQYSLFLALLSGKTWNINFIFQYSYYSLMNKVNGFDNFYKLLCAQNLMPSRNNSMINGFNIANTEYFGL